MPTTDALDEEVDKLYDLVEDIITTIPRRDLLIVMGDFNAKVGNTANDNHLRNIVGK